MRRAEKAQRIGAILDERFPDPPIPLDHRDPYTLLVAVLLSAQCTDKRVNEITPRLFRLADNPADMARVEVEHILDIVRPCGLGPAKSKAISGLSRILVRDHGGEVPADLDALESLPGVGHKTASVVMAQAFGVPSFPVDTHIHRLANRWGLTRSKNVTQTERDLKRVFPVETWNRRHIQIILFGRQHCPARGHDLRTCPICGWAATKIQIEREQKKNKKKKDNTKTR